MMKPNQFLDRDGSHARRGSKNTFGHRQRKGSNNASVHEMREGI